MFRERVNRVLFAFGILAVVCGATFAQPASSASGAGRRFAGEKLVYDGKVSKFAMSFSVAELTFTASEVADSGDLLIKAEAVSKGTLTSLFKFSFLQQINSNVDLDDFRAARTEKHDVQKERIRDSEAVFDYAQKRVTFVETDPKDTMRPPRRIASDISDPSHDLVSAIYFMRLQDLSVGKKFDVEVSDSGLVYKIPVVVVAREKKSTLFGKQDCWKVEPDIFGPGRLIEKEGKLTIWMTADERHIPVLAKINSGIGTVNVKLKSYVEPGRSQTARNNN
jgi:hypothetical protein